MLMFYFSYDPTRLLLSLGADVNKKDLVQGNTPLHWGLQVSNHTALTLICKQNVDLNALNLTVSQSIFSSHRFTNVHVT